MLLLLLRMARGAMDVDVTWTEPLWAGESWARGTMGEHCQRGTVG